jgi:hypothetical protein
LLVLDLAPECHRRGADVMATIYAMAARKKRRFDV